MRTETQAHPEMNRPSRTPDVRRVAAPNASLGIGASPTRYFDAALSETPTTRVISTGLRDLDDALDGGLRRGQLACFAGVTGVGTSVFALSLARAASLRAGIPAVLIAPDSSELEIGRRLCAAEAGVPLTDLRTGEVSEEARRRLREAGDRTATSRLIVSADWASSDSSSLHGAVEDYAPAVGIAVVDAPPQSAAVVRHLKAIAQRHDIAVVLTVKTTLHSDPSYAGCRPRLGDLRGPQELVELADVVVAMHRDDLLHSNSTRAGEVDVEILKHRHGAQRTLAPLHLQGHYARFVEMIA